MKYIYKSSLVHGVQLHLAESYFIKVSISETINEQEGGGECLQHGIFEINNP